jgi:hypothetical protein
MVQTKYALCVNRFIPFPACRPATASIFLIRPVVHPIATLSITFWRHNTVWNNHTKIEDGLESVKGKTIGSPPWNDQASILYGPDKRQHRYWENPTDRIGLI